VLLAFRIVALGIGPTLKGEIMSSNYVAQREALVDLSVAYEGARDFTRQVLCTALGSVPPPSECVWPPDITQAEADSRLRAVRHFLAQTEAVFKNVLRDIEAAQDRLVNSGFDVPRSWIITDPLHSIRGWYLRACGVEEIVRNAASEDSALQVIVEELSIDVRLLKGEISNADLQDGNFITVDHPHAEEYRDCDEWCTRNYAKKRYGLTAGQLTKAWKQPKGLFKVKIEPPKKVRPNSKGRALDVFLRLDLKKLADAEDREQSE
jgi:hypothetical protein